MAQTATLLTPKRYEVEPRYPVLQMLWGIITRTNVDYVELMWEEFIQAIQTFLVDKAHLGSPTKKGKKTKPHVIHYFRFTKLIIYYLGRNHNIHQRSGSPLNLAEDDLSLGNLKFVPKGEIDEVFGMQIPKELITINIRNAPYYNAYLEMGQAYVRGVAIREPVAEATRPLPMVEGKGKAIAMEEQASQSLLALPTPKRRNAEIGTNTDKVISEGDTKILNISEEQGEDVDNKVYLEEQTVKLDEGQAVSDPGKKEGGKKKTVPKADKPMKHALGKQAKPATAKQPKPTPVKEKSTKPTPLQKVGKGKVTKAQNVKSSLQLVDEPDEE
nr:hypothetical protein [Tanacetum cinerariifolium]